MNPWDDGAAGSTDLEHLVYLSNLIGADTSLVQPGGGNTSVKLDEEDVFGERVASLAVKGSGTDLRTITASGFTHLYLDKLAKLSSRGEMSDEDMMRFMRAAMLFADRDPLPSVETPLHSLLPAKFVAHTHDVATLSLTDTPSAAEHVRRALGDRVAFLEYVRPGFPLAKRMAEKYGDGPPAGTVALVMEKHGLCAWGETAPECYANLVSVIAEAEAYFADRATEKRSFGAACAPELDMTTRRDRAAELLPAIRGEMVRSGYPCVLALDDSTETLNLITGEQFAEIASRGVMTPEHILRAGVRPLVLDPSVGVEQPRNDVSNPQRHSGVAQPLQVFREQYNAYAAKHGQTPIADALKTIVIPGVGIVFAGKDRRNALIAGECYRATMQVMANAEAVERFEFLSDADACEMEYWPLERRKLEEGAKTRKDLEGRVALVVGGGSGIGAATAKRLAAEGAHVLVTDIDAEAALKVAAEIEKSAPERAHGVRVDATDADSIAVGVRTCVLRYGGIDVLFYSPGIPPELQGVDELADAEVRRQLAVHYEGAVAVTREVSRVMLAQACPEPGDSRSRRDTGGRLIYNASKAAFAPGESAAAYGASKAALVHYVRNVANELGQHGITANYVNADAADTPLFRALVKRRSEQRGVSEAETLARYAERSALRQATVPAESVAEAVLWLASDRAAHTTGCAITVGGGAEGFPR